MTRARDQARVMIVRVGDKVQLKSGGPIMTVEQVGADETVVGTWQGQGNVARRGRLPTKVLRSPTHGK